MIATPLHFGKFNPYGHRSFAALDHKRAFDLDSDWASDEYDESESGVEVTPTNFTPSNQETSCRTLKPPTPEQLIICSPLLKGYALKQKQWLEFLVDIPTDISWNDSAFQSLVLPPSQKELIFAIASSQISNSSKFDDVISGKGKGTIFLLSGGPGTDKTLTAESVAETMQVHFTCFQLEIWV